MKAVEDGRYQEDPKLKTKRQDQKEEITNKSQDHPQLNPNEAARVMSVMRR